MFESNTRRGFLSKLLAGAAATTAASAVTALLPAVASADEWCSVDPPIYIETGTGEVVVLHVTMFAHGAQHLPTLELAKIDYDSRPNRQNPRDTDVFVQVTVPNDRFAKKFPVKSVVSALEWAKGTVYSHVVGKSHETMEHRFVLPAAHLKDLEKVERVKKGSIGPKKVRRSGPDK